jgi:hypothetical protein
MLPSEQSQASSQAVCDSNHVAKPHQDGLLTPTPAPHYKNILSTYRPTPWNSLSSMAEVAPPDHQNLPPSPVHKRKRGADTSSPESRRPKRGAVAAMAHPVDAASEYLDTADGPLPSEFTALQAATAADSGDASDPANASSTAAAALGTLYPSIHVPQSTEETFAAQAVDNDGADSYAAGDASHGDGMGLDGTGAGIAQNGSRLPKPAVGSEEWHKMRKDNHKEGECRLDPQHMAYLTRLSRASAPRDHQRGHQRACQDRAGL